MLIRVLFMVWYNFKLYRTILIVCIYIYIIETELHGKKTMANVCHEK